MSIASYPLKALTDFSPKDFIIFSSTSKLKLSSSTINIVGASDGMF